MPRQRPHGRRSVSPAAPTARLPRLLLALLALPLAACLTEEARLGHTGPRPAARSGYGPTVDDYMLGAPTRRVPVQLDVALGLRQLVEDTAWAPVNNPVDVGLVLRTPVRGTSFLSFDLGGRFAYDQAHIGTTEYESQTIELDAGLVVNFARPGELVQPYLGAGLALFFVENEVLRDEMTGASMRARDALYGRYIRTGLAVEFQPAQLVGVEFRVMDAGNVSLDGASVPLNAYSVALTFGARF